jgi:rhodanese-related sulfurtransferase
MPTLLRGWPTCRRVCGGAATPDADPSHNPVTMDTFDTPPVGDDERAQLEISLGSAMELVQLGLATMIDIRQGFEIEMKGAIPGTEHIPLFEVRKLLGDRLTENEQEVLDTGKPSAIDIKSLITTINRLHHSRDHLLLLTCNSGRRSLYAASLLRSLGYPKALSVAGGFQAWKKLQVPPR